MLLEKALKVQIVSANKLKSNVHTVELLEPEEENFDFQQDLDREKSNLKGEIIENLDKLRRLENAQKILLDKFQK